MVLNHVCLELQSTREERLPELDQHDETSHWVPDRGLEGVINKLTGLSESLMFRAVGERPITLILNLLACEVRLK